jgi:hypothetical protein
MKNYQKFYIASGLYWWVFIFDLVFDFDVWTFGWLTLSFLTLAMGKDLQNAE